MKKDAARSYGVVMGYEVGFGVETMPLKGPWRRSARSDVALIGRIKIGGLHPLRSIITWNNLLVAKLILEFSISYKTYLIVL